MMTVDTEERDIQRHWGDRMDGVIECCLPWLLSYSMKSLAPSGYRLEAS